jgi:hypothetical protein
MLRFDTLACWTGRKVLARTTTSRIDSETRPKMTEDEWMREAVQIAKYYRVTESPYMTRTSGDGWCEG